MKRLPIAIIAILAVLVGSLVAVSSASADDPNGPVGYWPGDGNANDSSSHGNNGTPVGGTSFADGKVGHAFSFNASDGGVRIPADPSLNILDEFTAEAWIRPTGPANGWSGSGPIVEYVSGVHLWSHHNTGTLYANLVDANVPGIPGHHIFSAPGVLALNRYQHVALTYSKASGIAKLYVDGVEEASTNVGSFDLETAGDFYIGQRPSTSFAALSPVATFNGIIDEVRIYNRALLASEMGHLAKGLVGHWEAEGNAFDSADSNDGTLLNGAIATATGIVGGTAFSFDGVDDYVQVGDKANLRFTDALTMSAWIYPTAAAIPGSNDGGGIIVNKEGEYEIARFADGTIRWAIANSSGLWFWTNTGVVAPQNQWAHVAAVYDAGAVRVYINGSLVQTFALSGSTIGDNLPGSDDFRIGARQGGFSQEFQGRIDDVRVYDLALSPSEISHQADRLIGYWAADSNADDSSGHGFNGTFSSETYASGMVGQAFSLDGTDDYVEVQDSDLWALGGNDFTIDLWANFGSAPGEFDIGQPDAIFIGNDEGGGPNDKWFFGLGGGFLNLHVFIQATGVSHFLAQTPFSPNTNQWYHLAVSRTEDTFSIYVDGDLSGSESSDVTIPNPDAPLTIGRAEAFFMDGLIDEVRVFGRALSGGEIWTAAGRPAIRVAVVERASGGFGGPAATVTQLNNDTFFDFTATLVSPSEVDSVAELADFDVVVLGGSGNLNNNLGDPPWSTDMANAIVAFVEGGGGLLVTGFGLFNANITGNNAARPILDTVAAGDLDSSFDLVSPNTTINLTDLTHPITRGLPWSVSYGSGFGLEINPLPLQPGDISLGVPEGDPGLNPDSSTVNALIYRQDIGAGSGRSAYLGAPHLGSVSSSSSIQVGLRSGDGDQLLEQAVAWLSDRPKALLFAREVSTYGPEIASKILSTGRFSKVDVLLSQFEPIPSLAKLQEYSAVMVWSDYTLQPDGDALGDVLADYVDSGGRVVVATFALSSSQNHAVGGRLVSGGYLPVQQGSNLDGTPGTLVPVLGGHPLLTGVNSFNGGSSSWHNDVTMANGGTLVASWSFGGPLVAIKGNVVALNFFPPSSDSAAFGFWDATTDGGVLMANALSVTLAEPDTTPPEVTAPPNIFVPASGTHPALTLVADLGTATATDAVDGPLTPTNDAATVAPGDLYSISFTTITWTATDLSGNSASATQQVVVLDITPPELTVPEDIIVYAEGPVDFEVSASDDFNPNPVVGCYLPTGSEFGLGVTTVTCSANDAFPGDSVSWWPAEGNADDAADSNDGSLRGVTFAPGIVGQAFSFPSAASPVVIVDHNDNLNLSELTISAWIKAGTILNPYWSAIASKESNTVRNWWLGVCYAGASCAGQLTLFGQTNGVGWSFIGGPPLNDNTFHHIAVTYDGAGSVQFYVDGVPHAATQFGGPAGSAGALDLTSGPVRIGNWRSGGGFHGLIDELNIYSHVLSAGEILANFVSPGNGAVGSFDVTVAQLTIDIKPGSENNPLNLSGHGVLPVGLFGGGGVDVSLIDFDSLSLRRALDGASPVPPAHAGLHDPTDINGDGVPDLKLHFKYDELGIVPEDILAGIVWLTLVWHINETTQLEASDFVSLRPVSKYVVDGLAANGVGPNSNGGSKPGNGPKEGKEPENGHWWSGSVGGNNVNDGNNGNRGGNNGGGQGNGNSGGNNGGAQGIGGGDNGGAQGIGGGNNGGGNGGENNGGGQSNGGENNGGGNGGGQGNGNGGAGNGKGKGNK